MQRAPTSKDHDGATDHAERRHFAWVGGESNEYIYGESFSLPHDVDCQIAPCPQNGAQFEFWKAPYPFQKDLSRLRY